VVAWSQEGEEEEQGQAAVLLHGRACTTMYRSLMPEGIDAAAVVPTEDTSRR
jgi:hypothetical protein